MMEYLLSLKDLIIDRNVVSIKVFDKDTNLVFDEVSFKTDSYTKINKEIFINNEYLGNLELTNKSKYK